MQFNSFYIIIHEEMDDNEVFMVNGKGDAIVMKIM